MMYTSGSTGEPKGVEVSLSALHKFLNWIKEEFQISSEDRFSYTSSLGFGASIRQIFSPVLSGSQMFCLAPETVKSPCDFLNELEQKQITLLNAPPIVLQQLAHSASKQKKDKNCLKSVRLVLAGGDLFPREILDLWYEQFKHPHNVVNLYGSTESIVNASCYKTSNAERGCFAYKLLPIGKPRPDFSFLLLDEKGKLIDREEKTGELYIKSSFLSSGYHNNREETKKIFSFLKEEKETLYNTGDRALKLPSKDYLVLGRKDTQVQIYGQRLELGEIENTLNSHPQVKRSFVVHFKEDSFDKIFTYIQMKDQKTYNEKALRNFLSEELPSYMMPHGFQKIDQIPTTGSNKVDYRKLKELAREKLFKPCKVFEGKNLSLSSLNDKELASEVKNIWERYLGEKTISNDQSFFDVGGDSVLAVSLYQSLCEDFSSSLDPYVFYTSPTINNIVKALRQTQGENSPTEEKCKKEQNLSFENFEKFISKDKTKNSKNNFFSKFNILSVQNMKKTFMYLFLKALKLNHKVMSFLYKGSSLSKGPQSPQQKSFAFMKQIFNETYNGYFSIPVQKFFDREEFKQALQLVINSQESLRTVFVGDEQIVLSDYPSEILFYDLKSQSEEEQKKTIKKTEEKLLKHKFDFSTLPLFKLALFDLSKDKSHLIFCINHIVGDGWSLQAFLSELNKSYSFLKRGDRALSLHSYLDYTKKYKAFCRANFSANQDFWHSRLTHLSSYNLSPQFENVNPMALEESLKLSPKFAEKVSGYAKKQKTQEFYVYLAVWAESLKEFLNCSKICFWTTYHGRDFPFKGINTMIGSIARVAPLFIALHTEDKTKLLQAVQTAYLDSLKHKDFNIAKVFLSNSSQSSVLNNWIGFNYFDFKPLSELVKKLPFSMDLNKGEIRLSSSGKSYQRLYAFFSIHNYKDHLDLRVYGKAITEHKKQMLSLMKYKLEQLFG